MKKKNFKIKKKSEEQISWFWNIPFPHAFENTLRCLGRCVCPFVRIWVEYSKNMIIVEKNFIFMIPTCAYLVQSKKSTDLRVFQNSHYSQQLLMSAFVKSSLDSRPSIIYHQIFCTMSTLERFRISFLPFFYNQNKHLECHFLKL